MRDIVTAAGSVLVGAFVVHESSTYPRIGDLEMQAGFYPGILGYLMLAFGVILAIGWAIGEKKPAPPSDTDYKRLGILCAALILYAFCMETLGYAISTFLFVAVAVRLFRGSYKASLVTGLLCSLALTGLFQVVFRSPLPSGAFF